MKSAGKARNNGLYRHIRTSKEIIRNLLNDYSYSYICYIQLITPDGTQHKSVLGSVQSVKERSIRSSRNSII